MNREQVRARIEEIGIIPAVRVSSAKDACFAAQEVAKSGIAIVEITMTVPEALEVVSSLVRNMPELVVGAGTVLTEDAAQRCLDAGAHFITSTGFDPGVIELTLKANIVAIPGALTPTEVIAAWKAGSDFVKVFPCAQLGGPPYIRALKNPLPHVKLIAAGGVNQRTASDFIRAGAVAIGVGTELIPPQAIENRDHAWIAELARRFTCMVREARGKPDRR
jgi:2-dehydro-3-deoxyphosphogluconate aldolase / (4S)-4-hydroxy-2-oxoglutarate aldolase